ncbi:MAG TPA: porin [Fibrobacteria bacterium]|nr:porin [Fibrobacteria bacterium]
MRIGLSTLSLFCVLLPAAAQTAAPAAASSAPQEEMDSTDAGAIVLPAPAVKVRPPSASDSATVAADSATVAPPSQLDAFLIHNKYLSRLDLSGTLQLKAFYHDFTADRDADKRLSLELRRFKLELDGGFDAHSGFRGELRVDGNGREFGVDNAYLYYTMNDLVGFKGGKLKRPFSQEALQSSTSLYTIERGELYHHFLANTTGYAYFDLGVVAYGGFTEEDIGLGYEIGVFNGKQNDSASKDYGGQQDETTDKGFKAKDVVMRVTVTPMKRLKLEGAVSTKAAEDKSDPADFGYAVNTAYEVGADFSYDHLRLLGEASWGDNQNGLDANIIDGSTRFFTFYVLGVWHEDYARGRASELVLKAEALDPDFKTGRGEGTPNDGKARYTLGVNYFFTPSISLMADYGILQPITKVAGEKDLMHDVDLLWRMNF